MTVEGLQQVSVESSTGRVLTGTGVTEETLEKVIERHEPPEAAPTAGTDAPPASGPTAASVDPPKPSRGRQRYSDLTKERDDAKAKADAAEKKAAELEAKLAQQGKPLDYAAMSPEQREAWREQQLGPVRTPQQPPPTRPEPTEEEVGTKYATYAAFTKDQALWVWEQQQATIQQQIQQGIAQHQQQTAQQTRIAETQTKGRAAYPDFDQVLNSGSIRLPAQALAMIYALPHSEHVQYALLKDPALGEKVSRLAFTDPYAFSLELTKLAPPVAPPASTGPPPVLPPAPVQPVGAASKTTILSSADAAKAGDYEAYKQRRAAERGGSRRR